MGELPVPCITVLYFALSLDLIWRNDIKVEYKDYY